jgi:hypothetical protein
MALVEMRLTQREQTWVIQFPHTSKHCDTIELAMVIVVNQFLRLKVFKGWIDKSTVDCGARWATIKPGPYGSDSTR